MTGFVKLYGTIITSSIWLEKDSTLRVWITMLATADKNGFVAGSIGGLAHVSRVSRLKCVQALEKFLAPDDDSRTKTDDGRRIEAVDGGWRIINHKKYRDMRTEDQVKEAERKANWRAKSRNGTGRDSPGTEGDIRTDTDAYAYTPSSPAVESFLDALPVDQNPEHWLAILNGWLGGLGFEGGKAASQEDLDTGLTEYMATAKRDFAVIHVRSFVERARRNRLKSAARNTPTDRTEEATRIWGIIKPNGIHHMATSQERWAAAAALVEGGVIKGANAFIDLFDKFDRKTLLKAETDAFAIRHIAERLNGATL